MPLLVAKPGLQTEVREALNRRVTHLQRQSLQMRDSRKVGFSVSSVEVADNPVFRDLRIAARLGLGPLASGGSVNLSAFLRTNIPKLAQ